MNDDIRTIKLILEDVKERKIFKIAKLIIEEVKYFCLFFVIYPISNLINKNLDEWERKSSEKEKR